MKFVLRFVLTLLLATLSVASTGVLKRERRILGGRIIYLRNTTFMARIFHQFQHICGGSAIRGRWVLTAASCVHGLQATDVFVHTASYLRASVSEIHIPSEYNPLTGYMDLALLERTTPLYFIRGKSIPISGVDIDQGAELYAYGWGTGAFSMRNQPLRVVKLRAWSNKDCQARYGNQIIHPTMICVGEPNVEETHSTDAGGPFVLNNEVVAVDAGRGGIFGRPSMGTRIRPFMRWIHITSVRSSFVPKGNIY